MVSFRTYSAVLYCFIAGSLALTIFMFRYVLTPRTVYRLMSRIFRFVELSPTSNRLSIMGRDYSLTKGKILSRTLTVGSVNGGAGGTPTAAAAAADSKRSNVTAAAETPGLVAEASSAAAGGEPLQPLLTRKRHNSEGERPHPEDECCPRRPRCCCQLCPSIQVGSAVGTHGRLLTVVRCAGQADDAVCEQRVASHLCRLRKLTS